MPSLSQDMALDEVAHTTVLVAFPNGKKLPFQIGFYLNRIGDRMPDPALNGHAPPSDAPAGVRQEWLNAVTFCYQVASWDVTGALKDESGHTVVPEGDPVPLEPEYVRLVPSWIRVAIQRRLTEIMYPNVNDFLALQRR